MKVTVRDATPGGSLVTTVDLAIGAEDLRNLQIALWDVIAREHDGCSDAVRAHVGKLYNEIYRVTGIGGI